MNGRREKFAIMISRSACIALLMCSMVAGCQTVKPANPTLVDLQSWATPEPLDRLSPPHEQRRAKAAMVRWVEEYLKHEYRVIDQRFVLTAPGFTESASIGAKAHQYVTQTLGGTLHTDGWLDDDRYALFLWKIGESSPRYIAFVVMANGALPGTNGRRLVGYFELAPSPQR